MKYISFFLILAICFSASADNRRDIIESIRNDDVSALKALIPASEEELIKQKDSSIDILSYAVSMDAKKIFSELVKIYPEYTKTNAERVLTLACASNRKDREIIDKMLSLGVNINTINKSGANCLYFAVISADASFFDYLITKGADPLVEVVPDDVFGYTDPISVARFLKNRLADYQEMESRITSLGKRR